MSKLVLVVDDAAFMRIILRRILEEEGLRVIEATNGKEMLDMYSRFHPDLVTLDITMDVMNGLDGIKTLKSLYPDAKVIMCSAMGQKAMVTDAILSGAGDFIIKPFQKERVLEAIRKQLGYYKK